ncbi:MAG: thiamine pyrophosphate-dependent enzyme [Alphaproteobacteria bacterium]|nr:thiamine pyrophosphate-dependent enzyme [Alphaproteobacteria bacterium]
MTHSERHSPLSVLDSGNAPYILELFQQYKNNPDSVSSDWRVFFEDHDRQAAADHDPASNTVQPAEAFRTYGHLAAELDPLGLVPRPTPPELYPSCPRLTEIYCGKIGFEFMHLATKAERDWFAAEIENKSFALSDGEKNDIYHSLLKTESFAKFLHIKFPGAKRFGLDGGESLIPAMEYLLNLLSGKGVQEIIIGMAHRGRLEMMSQILKRPLDDITNPPELSSSGDVRYHTGYESDRVINGRPLTLSIANNPSHLESVVPVTLGKVRGKQDAGKNVVGLLIHGDAAFAGQGIVAESLQLCQLDGYKTGGSIHIIINNQIGFTTDPTKARSSRYCSDGAKTIQAPILHVNADYPESVIRAVHLAAEYRFRFHHDAVIDLVCYRRHGHNEGDEPVFTQPIMYRKITAHPSVASLYGEKLRGDGICLQPPS